LSAVGLDVMIFYSIFRACWSICRRGSSVCWAYVRLPYSLVCCAEMAWLALFLISMFINTNGFLRTLAQTPYQRRSLLSYGTYLLMLAKTAATAVLASISKQ